jgi:hypothetical protein
MRLECAVERGCPVKTRSIALKHQQFSKYLHFDFQTFLTAMSIGCCHFDIIDEKSEEYRELVIWWNLDTKSAFCCDLGTQGLDQITPPSKILYFSKMMKNVWK